MAFPFCAGDLSGGCVNAYLLILTGVRLVLGWSSGPICEDGMSEGLKAKFTFPGGAEESISVRFIQNGNGTVSAAHTLVPGGFGGVEQYWGCGDVIGSDVIWSEFVAKACKTYWVRPAGRCRGISSASYGLAQDLLRTTVTRGLAAGPDMFEGRSRYSNLSPRGGPSGWLCVGEGPTTMIFKGSVQLREKFSLRALLSAPLRSPC